MSAKTLAAVVLAGGLAFGIGMPAHAADAVQENCTTERVLVSPALQGTPAVYGDAPLITPEQAAWIERVLVSPAVEEVSHIVHHPAQYAERVVIDQPYVPATPAVEEVSYIVHHPAVTETVHHPAQTEIVHHEAVTKVVRHPAVTEIVHHDAVTHTEYQRYSWVGGGSGPSAGDTPLTQPSHWNANNKKYDGSATGIVHQGNGNGSYFFWTAVEVVDKPAWDETITVTPARDEVVIVTPAWDETVTIPARDEVVVVKEAWDEKVVYTPARPGTPEQPEISHIEYDLISEAWDELVIDVPGQDAVYAEIEHPATPAVYGERPLISPAIAEQPALYEDQEVCTIISAEGPETPQSPESSSPAQPTAVLSEGANTAVLAQTGGGVAPAVPLIAGALVAGGAGALLLSRRARRAAQEG